MYFKQYSTALSDAWNRSSPECLPHCIVVVKKTENADKIQERGSNFKTKVIQQRAERKHSQRRNHIQKRLVFSFRGTVEVRVVRKRYFCPGNCVIKRCESAWDR
ncbi:hypothetical protein JTB14_026171 [Gonioctena quinquepunctata]|nr:hypothetical protein JTB14_026171 [Gonioctena quinquepunctata]